MKIKTGYLLLAMVAFQAVFVVAAGGTGAAPDLDRLAFVGAFALVVGAILVLMPDRMSMALSRCGTFLVQNDRRVIMTLGGLGLVVGLMYARNLRPVFDETSIFAASQILADRGLSIFFKEYGAIAWLGRQHPPLVPLIYGAAIRLFGADLFVLRVISVLFTTGVILLTFRLGAELENRATGFIAALFLATFTYVFRLGAAASNDIPVTFFFVLTMLLVLRSGRMRSYPLALAAGISMGLGLLTKYTMVLIYLVLGGYWLVDRSFRQTTPYLAAAILASLTVFAPWATYAAWTGILGMQGNVLASYAHVITASRSGVKLMLEWVVARLPSAIGPYNLPVILLGVFQSARSNGHSALLLLCWVSILFGVLCVTLPDTRYFLPMFPALAIIMARGIRQTDGSAGRIVLLALLLCGSALYLFVDWQRTVMIFLH
jgi:4-amino-4-deoxy-L-arabinose transferase-like glycosyltransferase